MSIELCYRDLDGNHHDSESKAEKADQKIIKRNHSKKLIEFLKTDSELSWFITHDNIALFQLHYRQLEVRHAYEFLNKLLEKELIDPNAEFFKQTQ